MAIAVLPDGPRSRRERATSVAVVVIALLILGLFVYSLLDAYLF